MENFKKPYEISLWEDVLTFVVDNEGVITEYEESLEGAIGTVIAQYYKERKICTIGSNTMDTPIRAVEGKLVSNVNGSNILTFKLFSHYYDEDTETFLENPFTNLLFNERKVKLRHGALGASDTKWYDLIIKNVDEDSENKCYNYTAKDLFINELSKSGFNLEFDTELENNMGTVVELGEKVLAESDWKVKDDNDVIRQYIEEPLYEITLSESIEARDMLDSSKTLTLEAGKIIYGFYNCIQNKTPYFQFLYAEEYEVDDDYVIISESNWYIDEVSYSDDNLPSFARYMHISDQYRGDRLVRKIQTTYDAKTDKYVTLYKDGESTVYGFMETDYHSPAAVRSFVTNGTDFSNDVGWEPCAIKDGENTVFPELEMVSVPDIRDVSDPSQALETYLKFTKTKDGQMLYNSGIIDYRQYIDGFVEGEQYVFRVKYGEESEVGEHGAKSLKDSNVGLKLVVADYTLSEGVYQIDESNKYFEIDIATGASLGYLYTIGNCKKSLSYTQMIEMSGKLGMFIIPNDNSVLYFSDVQLFKYVSVKDENGNSRPLLPNEIGEAEVVNMYYYYYQNSNYSSIDDVEFIYKDTTPADYEPKYNEKFEKVRSITAKESNRFNLIQDLCETFECWPKFEIEHNELTGEILLDDNYRQKKWVSFHEYIGKENDRGFKYGINLKSIQRKIDSEQIASKIIVKNNSNEFGKNGFCSIARASENPTGENFILDFGYYIRQGMIGLAELTNDFYLDVAGYIGYYKNLKRINTKRDLYIEEQAGLFTDISDYQSSYQTYSTLLSEAEEQLADEIIYIKSLTGFAYEELINGKASNDTEENTQKISEWRENSKVIQVMASIGRLKTVIANNKEFSEAAKSNLDTAQARYDFLTRALSSEEESEDEERLLLEKKVLNEKFYKKYSRFLQEGSWISEDYIDDELYYLDGCGTARTSSQPQITYTINVLEISQVEGYENYVFNLGDKTTIEDTEFFGWVLRDGLKTPYREEVVISEIAWSLDSPEQNEVKVQNYKTQFEDLFQRMAATTQSVEYHTGQYNKVSNIIEPNGTITLTTLQNSISNNALILSNARDQSVIWDETGITTTSLRNPAEIVRIVSGGIFLSTDGGVSWNTGLTAKGINANYITSGQLNTERINILSGSFPSFRWDGTGISAYKFELNQDTREVSQFDYGKFVRLDQYGLYGINGYPDFDSAVLEDGLVGEDKIWDKANFALTWRGFMLKSNHEDGGFISITSDNDFQVIDGNGSSRIKLGRLNEDVYGLQILKDNQVIMEQNSTGELWIKNEIKIGDDNSTVSIGYLPNTKENSLIHETINANNKFIVYEDGSMVATDGEFTGTIHAIDGTIGGLDINSIAGSVATDYEVQIESDSGLIFKNGEGTKVLTARVYKGFKEITSGITYQWYKDETIIPGATSKTYNAVWTEDSGDTEVIYSCGITMQ